MPQLRWAVNNTFLSTPSARRATATSMRRSTRPSYFYPRPLRGGRLFSFLRCGSGLRISIHALCEEGDGRHKAAWGKLCAFLSTPSARRATFTVFAMESSFHHFYPRPLRGGRRVLSVMQMSGKLKFLSTPSARRATGAFAFCQQFLTISIHALCEEGDIVWRCVYIEIPQFLSTPSARRATEHKL